MNDNTVKCPSCNEVFKVDDSVYNTIVKQVRDQQFHEELNTRLDIVNNEKNSAIKLKESELKNIFQSQLSQKQREIDILKEKSKADLVEEVSKKDSQIRNLQSKLDNADTLKELALTNAIKDIEKERDQLKNELNNKEIEKELLEKSLQADFKNKLENKDIAIQLKEDEIDRLKDFKQKQSTKMLGESLEQHCEVEFNKLRATAFQNAYFEKDNDASGGTKGDYIFRESDSNNNEVVSIMFEMKTENDITFTKKKNEDFFQKLDKDRLQKSCEYAVLVSTLEANNEFYNTGIVDVSYRHKKMYVIRPQFFIPMITLLRNAGLKSLEYKQQLNIIKNQNIDISDFEDKIIQFRDGFNKNYLNAASQFETAMVEIDKSISHLNKIKEALRLTSTHLNRANNKAEDLTIKKLTYGNPTMKEKFKNSK